MNFPADAVTGTLYSQLLASIKRFGKKTKIINDINQSEQSYAELLKVIIALACKLEKNSRPGQKIGVFLPNLAVTAAVIFALTARGRIPAMLNFASAQDYLQNACLAAGIEVVVTSKKFVDKLEAQEKLAQLTNIKILYLEDLRAAIKVKDKLWIVWHLLFPRLLNRVNETAVILFTSGSEGMPKGVALSHRAILTNIAQIKTFIDLKPDDKGFNPLPMFHALGLTVGTFLPLFNGIKLFTYPSPIHYHEIPKLIAAQQSTLLLATNTLLTKYAQFADVNDFKSLRYVFSGGEKLMEETRNTWLNKFNILILEGYGMTEASPMLALNTAKVNRLNSVGKFLPGIEYQLEKIAELENGYKLFVKGKNLMRGYYQVSKPGVLQPLHSKFGVDWYETGDVVYLDQDDFLFLVGREKRFAKIAGEMYSLETAERLAIHASPNYQHAALAVSDLNRGEKIILFTTDAALTRDQLLQAAQELKQPMMFVAKRIFFVVELPLLPMGKVNYLELKSNATAIETRDSSSC